MKKSSAPNALWWVAMVLAILGILMFQGVIHVAGIYSFWVEVVAFVIMSISAIVK